jgi:hypothetical protein
MRSDAQEMPVEIRPEIQKAIAGIRETVGELLAKLGYSYDERQNCLVEVSTGVRIKVRTHLTTDQILSSKPEYLR